MTLLHVDSSILGGDSASRKIAAATVEAIRLRRPDLKLVYRDLAAAPLLHLTLAAMTGEHPLSADDPAAARDKAASRQALEEFLAAETVVIGAPMYNFTIPSQLKAWIDRLLVPGKTFQYSPDGVKGLVGGKRVILVVSRGGFYGPGAPAAPFEHAESYLRAVLGFMGIADPEVIQVEGTKISAEQRLKAIDGALDAIMRLKAA